MKNTKCFMLVLALGTLLGSIGISSFAGQSKTIAKAEESNPLSYAVESENYTITEVGEGLVSTGDSLRPNAVRFGDKTSYLTITPKAGKTLADANGITVSFWQKTSNNAGNEFEPLLRFVDSAGQQAGYCPGGVNWCETGSSTSKVYVNTFNVYAMLTNTWKYITITLDFNNSTMYTYYNGTLFNICRKSSTVYSTLFVPFCNIAKSSTYTDAMPLYFRRDNINGVSGKCTESLCIDELVVEQGYTTKEQAAAKFAAKAEISDQTALVKGLTKGTDYDVIKHGNVASIYEESRPNAFWFSKYDQYIELAPKGENNLIGLNGFSLSFWQRCLRKSTSSSDVNASFNKEVTTEFGENFQDAAVINNDAWVNIVTVTGEDGTDAAICSSAVWSTKSDKSGTTYTDASERKLLMSNTWKYVTIDFNFQDGTIVYYVNGTQGATIPSGTARTAVLNKFRYSLLNGGSLGIRKPLDIRNYRNHSGMAFDNFRLTRDPIGAEGAVTAYNEALVEDFVDNNMHLKDYDPTKTGTGTGLCLGAEGYYAKAKTAYNNLSAEAKTIFLNSTDEKIVDGRNRLIAWATANGETFDTNGAIVSRALTHEQFGDEYKIMVIAIISILSLVILGFIKKRKMS